MKTQKISLNAPKVLLGVLGVLLATLICATFMPAHAQAADFVAHKIDASGKRTDYRTIAVAVHEGYAGDVIVMDSDWIADGTIGIESNKSITIDMNGHKITNSLARNVIRMYEGASLTLTSSTKTSFTYKRFDGNTFDTTTTSGGLVTGADVGLQDIAGGIWMGDHTTLTLDNVAVAGNNAGKGGGVRIDKESKLHMKNGAQIQNNRSKNGGGILVDGNDSQIIMESGSSVGCNEAYYSGGGICSDDDATRISMTGDSSINWNFANEGGGVFFRYSYCNILSDDKTASISNNTAVGCCGGGICIEEYRLRTNESEFRGIKLDSNKAKGDGGALCLSQRWSKVEDCVMTNNSSEGDGGAVFISGNNCTLSNCTITDNVAGIPGNGGGVYLSLGTDVNVAGKVIIKDNIRKTYRGRYKSNLKLTHAKWVGQSCIYGSVEPGSRIGISTWTDGDERIGEKVSSFTPGTYFMDSDGYYISHGSDKGGDLWQREGTRKFSVTVQGRVVGEYSPGETVTVDAKTGLSFLNFNKWSESKSTGLYPFSDYVKEETNPALTFTMPQNDVVLSFAYEVVEPDKPLPVPIPGSAS